MMNELMHKEKRINISLDNVRVHMAIVRKVTQILNINLYI